MTESTTEVTYLFSDVEGSTRLWETEPERIGPALARHDRLARATVESHGGRVVKMTGDGLHAAFADPSAAVEAVIEMQLAFAHPSEPQVLPLAVRCGLHLGVDQQRDGDFFGPAVNRAARVMAAAHGGQVLLSRTVADRVRARLPDGVALRDLGLARLRDLSSSEQLFQLVHPRLRDSFPPLRSLASTPNNLPQQVNSFVGRVQELEEVRSMLANPAVRLLTLLGMGGLGKSRLSLQAAAEVLDDFGDGVWFVELAPLVDPRSVPQAVATVMGVKAEAGGAVLDALLRYLRDKTALVVLDNCEHVVQACAELAQRVLQTAPGVKLMASSRDALQTAGETVIHVPPLAAPEADAAMTPAALAQIDAVRLFTDRAAAAQPNFRVTDSNAGAVAAICRRLDGIPLALELAAARTRAMTVEAIAARLDDRFKLLVTGDRTVLPRQRTLRALIDWSYDLLLPAERLLFARLSVFAGGWTLEAAESVGAGGEIAGAEVLDLVAGLVQKSLVAMDATRDRYDMLDTVRQYAAERLREVGDTEATRERHLGFYADIVEQARPHLVGPDQAQWFHRLDLERENVLVAHAWCEHSPTGPERDLRMASALKFYWLHRGLLDLGLRMTREALTRGGRQGTPLERCRGLSDAGQLCYFMGRYAEARGYIEDSLAIARGIADRQRIVAVLHILSMVEAATGNHASGLEHSAEALAIAREVGSERAIAAAMNTRGQLLRMRGATDEARRQYEDVLAICRRLADDDGQAIALLNLSMVAVAEGQIGTAGKRLAEVLEIVDRTDSRSIGQSLLEASAGLAAARLDWTTSACLYGAAEAQAARSGMRRDPADQLFLDDIIARTRGALVTALPDEAAGSSMTYEQALDRVRRLLGGCLDELQAVRAG